MIEKILLLLQCSKRGNEVLFYDYTKELETVFQIQSKGDTLYRKERQVIHDKTTNTSLDGTCHPIERRLKTKVEGTLNTITVQYTLRVEHIVPFNDNPLEGTDLKRTKDII